MKLALLASLSLGATAMAAAIDPAMAPRASESDAGGLVTRQGHGKSWAGTNNYFLQALSDADQQIYVAELVAKGIKVVRLFINGHVAGCEKGSLRVHALPELEEQIGQFNNATLDAVDKTIALLWQNNIKVILSPHNGNLIYGIGGKDVYGTLWPGLNFYTNPDALAAYDNRLRYILDYRGATSTQVWKTWDAIAAFDLQNEPFVGFDDAHGVDCRNFYALPWVCDRAKTLRGALGAASPIKIASGGLGGWVGNDCTFMQPAVVCRELDLIAVHDYPGGGSPNVAAWQSMAGEWQSVFLEEWGQGQFRGEGNTIVNFAENAARLNAAGCPWMYWQFLPLSNAQQCTYDPRKQWGNGSDPHGIYINDGSINVEGAVKDASAANAARDWTGCFV